MPELMWELKAVGMGHALVVVGGVVPPQDYPALKEVGVAAIYGPGTPIPSAAGEMVELLNKAYAGKDQGSGGGHSGNQEKAASS